MLAEWLTLKIWKQPRKFPAKRAIAVGFRDLFVSVTIYLYHDRYI